jgi:hypothetical protein
MPPLPEPLVEELNSLQTLGLTLPTPAYLFGAIIFGLLGLAGYRYGKLHARPYVRWLGVALMLYPYAISETWLLYACGLALCGAIYWFRNQD